MPEKLPTESNLTSQKLELCKFIFHLIFIKNDVSVINKL